jgi:hypothetical protein
MGNRFDHALQFKVTLLGIKPPIWRRILVPCDYSFWDLHVAIQDAMGWLDYHLHEFHVRDPVTRRELLFGLPNDDGWADELEMLPDWAFPVARFITLADRSVRYEYDFGDDWQHSLLLERLAYPVCVGGRRACPPEDCGGVGGYESMLDTIRDPTDEDHESMLVWLGGAYDPDHFDKDLVRFDDPAHRWAIAFGGMAAGEEESG